MLKMPSDKNSLSILGLFQLYFYVLEMKIDLIKKFYNEGN